MPQLSVTAKKTEVPFFPTFSFFFFSSPSPLISSSEPADDVTAVVCGTSSENEAVETAVPGGTVICFTKIKTTEVRRITRTLNTMTFKVSDVDEKVERTENFA